MNYKEYLERLREQIEIHKKNIIEEIQKEQMVPAQHSLSALIDLKAQESLLKRINED